MNRIYQGRIAGVEIPIKVTLPTKEGRRAKSEIRWLPFHSNPLEAQSLLNEVKPRILELGNVIGDLITKLQKARGTQNDGQAAQIAKDIAKAKTELHGLRKKLDEPWRDALWEHHQLFQDMVNCTRRLLLRMAQNRARPMNTDSAKPRYVATRSCAQNGINTSHPTSYSAKKKQKSFGKEVLKDHQREHRDDVGAVRLFEELQKEKNWCLWQAPTENQEKIRKEKNHSANILRDYLRYQEVVERIAALDKKVNYTPADASLSRRLFDFKAGAQGGFGHGGYDKENDALWFETQIAVKKLLTANSRNRLCEFITQHHACLRDAARVLNEDEKLSDANWMQPVHASFGG